MKIFEILTQQELILIRSPLRNRESGLSSAYMSHKRFKTYSTLK